MSRSAAGRAQVVVVFGPTGNAGAGVVQACLADPEVAEVRAVTRRPLGLSHSKLREVVCTDFADLAPIAADLQGVDACLFCLGTSVRNVEGEDQYREIHERYALVAARALLAASPGATFVYLSGAGAKRGSGMMWARVKAEAEDKLAALGLTRVASVRPGGLLPLNPSGWNRWLLAPLLTVFPPLGIRSLDLGRAMLRLVRDAAWTGNRTLENSELRALLREEAAAP